MPELWDSNFRAAFLEVLTSRGTIVESRSIYGAPYYEPSMLHLRKSWRDRRIEEQKGYRRQDYSVRYPRAVDIPPWCGEWREAADMVEQSVSEMVSTFDGNREVSIIVATVTCKCGFIDHERLEYEATVGEMIRLVLGADLPKQYSDGDYHRDDR